MSLLIYRFWTAIVFTFFFKMAQSNSSKKHLKRYVNVEELKQKAGLSVVERLILFENASHFK